MDDLRSQIAGEKIEVPVDVDESSISNIKSILDDIPDKKEIKVSIADYDKLPLLSDAAGNLIDVFRGTHGVFGFTGKDGISWFTDELELATQYADSLADDGKLLRANLAYKNPLEIFGNGADFDKLDLSSLS